MIEQGNLTLTMKKDEKVYLGESITITLIEIGHAKVKLTFSAPKDVCILRGKLKDRADCGK